jgi:predicted enzyme related to lactoylglutathione lyase
VADRVVHFEITADDPERAAEFYRRSFGWSIDSWGGPIDYRLASTGDGPGIDGAITARMHGQAVVNTIQVEGSLEDAVARVVAAGGSAAGDINPIPGVGRFTYARDTEGNVFGIMEPEPEPEA